MSRPDLLALSAAGHHLAAIRRSAPRPASCYHIDHAARAALADEIFGKHVLITSHDNWPVAEVVVGYRSQSEAEFSFRQLKDPHVVPSLRAGIGETILLYQGERGRPRAHRMLSGIFGLDRYTPGADMGNRPNQPRHHH